MELLGQKVKEDGVVIDEKILKVDGFLNHQIDAKLMNEVGRTFYEQFKDKGITKILTIEASGIAPAIMAALHFDVPCLFAKKAKPSTLTDGYYETSIHSFTKNKTSTVIVSKEFLSEEDTVLIIDDFLANGDASLGLYNVINQRKSEGYLESELTIISKSKLHLNDLHDSEISLISTSGTFSDRMTKLLTGEDGEHAVLSRYN
ncbi:xanthine phosphoribosyltransferase, partial [Staphylococcus aureus]|uniref:xanthine phosphoribosyltransferase n=2 Tax=Bacillales TaxID=1385 RepID=UPI001F5B689F